MRTLSYITIIFLLTFAGRAFAMEPLYFSTADYDISLYEVERPVEAKKRYGEQRIERIQEEGIYKYYFEDEMVKISWLPSAAGLSFVLSNKTSHSIKIIWDETSYVDENGLGHRTMHSGVKYTDRNNPQPPTVVVRKGSVNDVVISSDNVYWREGYYGKYASTPGGWEQLSLFPDYRSGLGGNQLKSEAEKFKGKTFQLLLPLQIESTVNDYIFTFKINDVVITDRVMVDGKIRKREDRKYVNKAKGFSITFPDGWETRENYMGFTVEAHVPSDNLTVAPHVGIVVQELPIDLTRSEQDVAFDNFILTLQKNPSVVIREISAAHLNNVQGKTLIYDSKQPPLKNMVFTTGSGRRMFIFSFAATEWQFQENRGKVEQILRSFNFE